MLAAASETSWLAIAGFIFGIFGLIGLLAGIAAFFTGASRKAIAEQRDQDIESQGKSIIILKERVQALEAELAIAKQTIANMTSQIKSGEALQRLVESMEARLKIEGK